MSLAWMVLLLPGRLRAEDYERWQQPAALCADERRIFGQVRRQALQAGVSLSLDARLSQAAQQLLGWAGAHAGEALPLPLVRDLAWRAGLTDGELSALAISTETQLLPAALSSQLAELLADNPAVNCAGLAQAREAASGPGQNHKTSLVLLFSRRLLQLARLPAMLGPAETLTIRGSTLDGNTTSVRLVLAQPGQPIVQRDLPLRPGRRRQHFTAQVLSGRSEGLLQLQLLLERGLGPEIAASFPVAVCARAAAAQRSPRPGLPGQPAAPGAPAAAPQMAMPPLAAGCVPASVSMSTSTSTSTSTRGPGGAAQQSKSVVMTMLRHLRAAHALPLPQSSPVLSRLAQRHAQDMAVHHFFAHVSPTAGNAAERLSQADQPFARVVENIAAAPSLTEAFAQWQASPAHLANLLDTQVDQVGLGAARSSTSSAWLVVLLMAAWPKPDERRQQKTDPDPVLRQAPPAPVF